MMFQGMYSMLSMACGDMFHNDSYDTFGMAAPGRGQAPPHGGRRAHAYTPSLVAAHLTSVTDNCTLPHTMEF